MPDDPIHKLLDPHGELNPLVELTVKDIFFDPLSYFACFAIVSAEGMITRPILRFTEVSSNKLQLTVNLSQSSCLSKCIHSC